TVSKRLGHEIGRRRLWRVPGRALFAECLEEARHGLDGVEVGAIAVAVDLECQLRFTTGHQDASFDQFGLDGLQRLRCRTCGYGLRVLLRLLPVYARARCLFF